MEARTAVWVCLVVALILTIATWAIVKFSGLESYGLEFPIVGFILGMLAGAALKPPREVFTKLNPWVLVDASLIILGLLSSYRTLAAYDGRAGVLALVNIAVTLTVGMLVAYKLGIDERFAVTFVSGGTVCGISAAIATGRAARAEFAHLVLAMLMIALVGAPFVFLVVAMGGALKPALAGALVGGTVDGTPVVEAIVHRTPGTLAGLRGVMDFRDVALAVKYSQNAMIPIVAIVLAFVASRLGGFEARIPLAVALMLLGSIASTIIGIPAGIAAQLKVARKWLLNAAMVLAGMATPFEALKKVGVKLAIIAFIVVEVVNLIVVFTLATILFG